MERYVISDLKNWVEKTRRKPLLLRGARQVGKTWLVEKLARELFDNFVKIDFEEGIVQTIKWYVENQEWWKRVKSGAYQEYYDNYYKNL